MAKKKKVTCPQIEPKDLHKQLGAVLVKERRDKDLYARDSEREPRFPPLSLLPFLP